MRTLLTPFFHILVFVQCVKRTFPLHDNHPPPLVEWCGTYTTITPNGQCSNTYYFGHPWDWVNRLFSGLEVLLRECCLRLSTENIVFESASFHQSETTVKTWGLEHMIVYLFTYSVMF